MVEVCVAECNSHWNIILEKSEVHKTESDKKKSYRYNPKTWDEGDYNDFTFVTIWYSYFSTPSLLYKTQIKII
jgi:hypothetical protein